VAAVPAGVPARVHTFHGHLLHGYFGARTTRAVIAVERVLAARTDRIVAVGERVRDDLLAAGIGTPEQYVVIAPGVTLRPLPGARARPGDPRAGPRRRRRGLRRAARRNQAPGPGHRGGAARARRGVPGRR
jgi:hypothetical protein